MYCANVILGSKLRLCINESQVDFELMTPRSEMTANTQVSTIRSASRTEGTWRLVEVV